MNSICDHPLFPFIIKNDDEQERQQPKTISPINNNKQTTNIMSKENGHHKQNIDRVKKEKKIPN